jgi:hypothetical protein
VELLGQVAEENLVMVVAVERIGINEVKHNVPALSSVMESMPLEYVLTDVAQPVCSAVVSATRTSCVAAM